MESTIMSDIRARLEVAEAVLNGILSPKEARARRAELLQRSHRGRLLLRIERIERAAVQLPQNFAEALSPSAGD